MELESAQEGNVKLIYTAGLMTFNAFLKLFLISLANLKIKGEGGKDPIE